MAQRAVLVCLEDKKWVCCRCVFADCVHGYLPAVPGCDRSSVLRLQSVQERQWLPREHPKVKL